MSFKGYKERIEYGDTVIVYMGFESMFPVEVESGKVHQTKYGAVKHDALVGLRFGSRVKCAKGFVHVLYPTPELWTVNLPHRTQILYATDISLVTLQLELKPGSVVVESGTGSASLSHSMLRTIAPSGHLYTFDFHALRVETAADEFRRHGLADLVTVMHRDVCKDGFGLNTIADAVFLDLPSPWEALPFAKAVLMPGGRICSFSPCVEQVQRACKTMADLGFTEIRTIECLLRPIDVRSMTIPMPDLGYGPGKCYVPDSSGSNQDGGLLSTNNVSEDKPVLGYVEIESQNKDKHPDKRRKKAKLNVMDDVSKESPKNENSRAVKDDAENVEMDDRNIDSNQMNDNKIEASYVFKSGLPALRMPGHTGYLTFATLYP